MIDKMNEEGTNEKNSLPVGKKSDEIMGNTVGGQGRYHFMHPNFVKGASICLVLYDGTKMYNFMKNNDLTGAMKYANSMSSYFHSTVTQTGVNSIQTVQAVIPVATKVDIVLADHYKFFDDILEQPDGPAFVRHLSENPDNYNDLGEVLASLRPKIAPIELKDVLPDFVLGDKTYKPPIISENILSSIYSVPYEKNIVELVDGFKIRRTIDCNLNLNVINELGKIYRLESAGEINFIKDQFGSHKISIMGAEGTIGKTALIYLLAGKKPLVGAKKDSPDFFDPTKLSMTVGYELKKLSRKFLEKGFKEKIQE